MSEHRDGPAHVATYEQLLEHLDTSPLAVIEWDERFRVRRWTGSAEALFGWAADEVLGLRPEAWRFVHEDDLDAVSAVMDDLLERRVARNMIRNRNVSKAGREVVCDWYNSVVHDDVRGTSILSLVDDVTERLVVEARARRAERLESVGELTGGVAHDFNNLLAVISGNAEMLAARPGLGPEERRMVRMIGEAAERGASLTRSLLAFARRQPLESRRCDLVALVRELAPLLRHSVGDAVELVIEAPMPSAYVVVDPVQFESALLNLMLNARDAMPDGGRVTVAIERVALGPDELAGVPDAVPGTFHGVRVTDTGVGVAKEHLDRVWEPFFTTKEAALGSGLGLSMVYGFARQSHGLATIASEVGIGTSVRLQVPAAIDAGEGDAPLPEATEPGAPEGSSAAGATVLVVEDDDAVRQMVVDQLESLGYRTLAATDGASALAHVTSGAHVDLLFSDVVMPGGMSGVRLAEAARSLRPDLPVLLTSGYAGVPSGVDEDGAPLAFPLLPKPYRRADLAAAIRAALGRRGDDG